jgi:hypothetical protein
VSKQNRILSFFFLKMSPLAGVQAHLRRGGGLRLLRHDGHWGCCTLCQVSHYTYTSGSCLRVRARALRAPDFLGLLTRQTGRCAPPHRSFAASPKIKKYSRNKMLPFWPELGCQGRISFHWAKLHPPYIAPS